MAASGSASPKNAAHELIDELPDDATWEDIAYTVYVRGKIERGRDSAREGQSLSHDEVLRLFRRS